jgi:DNA-binding NarL/FixJ family response regulator
MSSARPGDPEKTAPHTPLRVVVVDDHIFMRDLISSTLGRQAERYVVVASVGTASAAISACRSLTPDLVILDINLPDRSGIDAVPAIRDASPETHVLLCTAFPSEDRIIDALHVGAKGFVEKTNTWDDFLVAVDRVGRGEQYFCAKSAGVVPMKNSAAVAAPQTNGSGRSVLSPREQEVIRLIAAGCTSKEIASRLFISAATVETHRTNLMSKLGVRNVASLVLYAFQRGLVDPGTVPQCL